MKIVHIIDYFHPTMGYQENHLSRIQAREGHDVTVICSERLTPWPTAGGVDGAAVREGDLALLQRGVKVRRLPTSFEIRSRAWLKGLKQSLREIDPDFIHLHSFSSLNALQFSQGARLRAKVVIDDHMLFIASASAFAKGFHWFFRKFLAGRVLASGDVVVAVSEETRTFMVEAYGLPEERIALVPLGVDSEVFSPDPAARKELRQKLEIREGQSLFLYTGKIDRQKNPIRALEAATLLAQKGVDFRFVLVGFAEPSYLSELQCYVRAQGLEGRVLVRPGVPTEELAAYFNAADVAVWPTNCSMSSLEAMACGCPVILADLGANLERLSGGGGLSFPNGDLAGLADCMLQMSQDRELRTVLGAKALEYARQFDWQKINQKLFSLAGLSG